MRQWKKRQGTAPLQDAELYAIAAAFSQDTLAPTPAGPGGPAGIAAHPANGILQLEDAGRFEPVANPALEPDAGAP